MNFFLRKMGSGAGYTYLTETDTWAAACSTPPTTARKQLVDGLIRNLKSVLANDAGGSSASAWDSLDWLLLLAQETQQAGLVNLVNPSKVATWTAGTGSFTTDRGFTGDGTAAYISLGEALGAGGNYTLNSASRGVWCTQAGATGSKYQVGVSSGRALLTARNNSGNETFNINDATISVFQGNPGTRSGHRSFGRIVSTDKQGYFNGALIANVAVASTSLATNTAYILQHNGSFGPDQANAYWHGAGFDDAGHAAMHSILGTYLSAVGAI